MFWRTMRRRISHRRWIVRWPLVVSACVAVVGALVWPMYVPRLGATTAQPTLALRPARGRCEITNPPIAVQGEHFPPNILVTITVHVPRIGTAPDTVVPGAGEGRTDDNGVLTGTVALANCGPATPDGTQFEALATQDPRPNGVGPVSPNPNPLLARATFTVDSTVTPTPPGLPNTGGGGGRHAAPLAGNMLVAVALLALLGGIYSALRLRRQP